MEWSLDALIDSRDPNACFDHQRKALLDASDPLKCFFNQRPDLRFYRFPLHQNFEESFKIDELQHLATSYRGGFVCVIDWDATEQKLEEFFCRMGCNACIDANGLRAVNMAPGTVLIEERLEGLIRHVIFQNFKYNESGQKLEALSEDAACHQKKGTNFLSQKAKDTRAQIRALHLHLSKEIQEYLKSNKLYFDCPIVTKQIKKIDEQITKVNQRRQNKQIDPQVTEVVFETGVDGSEGDTAQAGLSLRALQLRKLKQLTMNRHAIDKYIKSEAEAFPGRIMEESMAHAQLIGKLDESNTVSFSCGHSVYCFLSQEPEAWDTAVDGGIHAAGNRNVFLVCVPKQKKNRLGRTLRAPYEECRCRMSEM